MASVGHAGALRLAGSGEPLISEVVTVDPQTGATDLTVQSAAAPTQAPQLLAGRYEVGDSSIHVAPGGQRSWW